MTGQLDEADGVIEDLEGVPESITDELSAMQDELRAINSGLGEARSNAGVSGAIQGSSTVPTEDQLWQIEAAWEAVPGLIERLNQLIMNRIPAFNASLDAEGIRPDPGVAIDVPRRRGG